MRPKPVPETIYDARVLRDALGCFATGITVVTVRARSGACLGITVNSFNSVSLDPPLVLWSLGENSRDRDDFVQASHFAVHVLSAEQKAWSQRFAARDSDKFAGLPVTFGLGGVPLLPGCCARFECANSAQYPGGDHLIFIGRIDRLECDPGRAPLIYHCGCYGLLSESPG